MNYNAYGLESSYIPSYISSSFDKVKASSGSTSAVEGTAVKSTTVTKTETVVMKTEEKKEKEEKKEEEKEQVEEEKPAAAAEEPEAVEKEEPEHVEAEAAAEEWFSILFWEIHDLSLKIKKKHILFHYPIFTQKMCEEV